MKVEYNYRGHKLFFEDTLLARYEKAFGEPLDDRALDDSSDFRLNLPPADRRFGAYPDDRMNRYLAADIEDYVKYKENDLAKRNRARSSSEELVEFECEGRKLLFSKMFLERHEETFGKPLARYDIDDSVGMCFGCFPETPKFQTIPLEELNKKISDDLYSIMRAAERCPYEDYSCSNAKSQSKPAAPESKDAAYDRVRERLSREEYLSLMRRPPKDFPNAINDVIARWIEPINKIGSGSCFPLDDWIVAFYKGKAYKISARDLDVDREGFMDFSDEIKEDLIEAGCDSAEFFQVYD